MRKEALIRMISEDARISKIQAKNSIEAILECVIESLQHNGKITFNGFGTFSISHRNERNGINPKTGEKIVIPARDVVVFKASKVLKTFIK